MTDYYAALGVSRDASASEIKRAFRRIARESHPDANPGDAEAEDRFRRAAEAYEVLSDPGRRAAYDRGDTVDFGDLFSSVAGVEDLLQRFFGGGFGFGAGPRRDRGQDLGHTVTITLAEAATGTTREVAYGAAVSCDACAGSGAEPGSETPQCDRCGGSGSMRATRQTLLGTAMSIITCDRCGGRGQLIVHPCAVCGGRGSVDGERSIVVEVPAGIDDGSRLRVSGGGHAGGPGEHAGDLYVEVRVEPDPRFERHGADLVHRVTVGLAEAALGTAVEVPIIDGDPEVIDLPAGTQPGTVFRLAKAGMPRLRSRGRGDLLVEVGVEVPTRLGREAEVALRAYAKAANEDPADPGRKRRKKK